MTLRKVNIGAYPEDPGADPAWRAFEKFNTNVDVIDAGLAAAAAQVTDIRSDLASTSDPEKGPGGLGYGPSQPYGTDTVGGELNRKRAQAVNVLDHGGSPSATTSVNNSAFQAAYTQAPSGGFIIVPPGNYNLSVIPASTGKVVTWIAYGATINGSVNNWLTIPGMVQASGGGFTTPTVFSMYATENQKPGPLLIRRSVNGSGGTNGYVTPALEVYTTVTGDGENFDWAFLSRLHNSSTGDGQNCAGYFRALRQVEGAAGTWGLCIEAADETAGAAGGQLVGLEIDIDGDGPSPSTSKTFVSRVALDVTARVKTRSGSGIFGRADYGVRIRTNSQGGVNDAGYKYAHLYLAGKTDGVVIDATDIEGSDVPVLCVKDKDIIRLSNSAERDIAYNPTNTALEYTVDGVLMWRSQNSGRFYVNGVIDAETEVRVSNIKVLGDRSQGWSQMTGTSSKSAINAAAAGTASASYTQSELQGALNRIAAMEARMRAYDSAFFAHGLIGA